MIMVVNCRNIIVGLGTSSAKEAREYFTDIERHTVKFIYDGRASDESIDLAFAKNKADDRKIWITESSKVSFC